MHKKLWFFSGLFVFIDQVIKVVITNAIRLNSSIDVIPDFFYLTNVHNKGAAFSILEGNLLFLDIVTIIALVLVYYFFVKGGTIKGFEFVLISMLFGGIIGNFVDRLIFGYVIDYLGFILFNDYHYPIFNFADICIVLSIIGLLLMNIRETLWKNIKLKKTQVE